MQQQLGPTGSFQRNREVSGVIVMSMAQDDRISPPDIDTSAIALRGMASP